MNGKLVEMNYWHPAAARSKQQFFGDDWEWTFPAYRPYPGFEPLAGSPSEFNGNFMCDQLTVHGGSCLSSADHVGASYRGFFYRDARWRFLDIRLARDGTI